MPRPAPVTSAVLPANGGDDGDMAEMSPSAAAWARWMIGLADGEERVSSEIWISHYNSDLYIAPRRVSKPLRVSPSPTSRNLPELPIARRGPVSAAMSFA
jgi:hypothetical protein